MNIDKLNEINAGISKITIGKKEYAQVPSRVLGFWNLYPNGKIITELIKDDETGALFKVSVYDDDGNLKATGHAHEEKSRSGVNATSHIENAETSAVGRALGFLGIGSNESIASAEEVQHAQMMQGVTATEEQVKYILDNRQTIMDEFKARNIKYKDDVTCMSIEEADGLCRLIDDRLHTKS